MNTEELRKALLNLDREERHIVTHIMQHVKAIDLHKGAVSYAQHQIAAKKREIQKAAVRLDLAKTACRNLEAAVTYPSSMRHAPEARYYLRLVVREHRKILNRLMQEQRVLKYSRVNAGAHLAEAQRLAAAYLQEGLDNPKS